MKKNNSIKLFNKLCRRVYKISKKRKLAWKWSDAQKWTSKNLFQRYKGTKNISKLKLTDIDVDVVGILDGTTPVTTLPITKTSKPKEVCFNPFEVGSYLLDSFEWFDIEDKVSILNNNLKVNLDLEYDGNVFSKTGIIFKNQLPNLIDIRENMRKVTNKSGYFPLINFYIVKIEGAEDNRDIACNYYVLITFEDSFSYNMVNVKGLVQKAFVSKEQMPTTEQERIESIEKEKEEERKLTKKKAKIFKLPSNVESSEPTSSKKDTKANRTKEYNIAIEKLESLLERKLITKKQFSQRFDELGKNLKDGGEI
jgi:hypothetical protein